FPALEATRAPPSIVLRRSTAETAFRANLVRTTAVGLGLSALGLGLLALPGKNLLLSYAGLFAILAGSAGVTPALTVLSAAGLRPLAGALFGPLGRMAARGVITHLSRNAVAIAALSTAVATTVSVALMVSSFRETVIQWLDVSLQADVFVSSPSLVSRGSSATLDPSVQERLRALPGTRGLSTIRRVRLNTSSGPSEVNVVQRAFPGASPYRFKEGDAEAVWRALETGDAVMVSEPFAFHRQVKVGDVLRLSTDRGDRPFRVAGIFYDFASDAGVVTVDRSAYERSFQDRRISGVALYASESEDADALVDRVRRALGDAGPVSIRSNRGLKQASLEVFDRTFTVTSVLRLLSVAVAFVGVLSALMALSLERARELAVLRALGLLPRQLWSLVTLQTGLLGLIAGLLSLPLGLAMASVLVHVINKRSFGWSLELSVTPGALAQAVGLAVGAALLAGLYPAWKMRRTPAALALREE
ncbi:MAG TPA: ABC transporter permease, partial [Myxococcaceae bacterium]|nr:ABC transporter permease [Myxococcaceae bacterium]